MELTHSFTARGAALEMMRSKANRILISGPAGTGKSRAVLEKLHLMCLLNRGMKGLIVRQTARSLTTSALATFERDVIPEALRDGSVRFYGGSARRPPAYLYSRTGASIALGGMDDPTKVMSTEYDCVVGETLVDSHSAIRAGSARPYSGQLVTITTAGGNQLTGTPNHPVLTDHGWRGLGSLREGDHVIRRARRESEVIGRSSPHVTDQPAPIAQVVRALALANPGGTKRVETVPMDFHGDGSYGYVDVVPAGRLLDHAGPTGPDQHVVKLQCERRDLQQGSFMSAGARVELRSRGFAPLVQRTVLGADLSHALPVRGGPDPFGASARTTLRETSLPVRAGVPNVTQGLSLRFRAGTHPPGGHLRPQSADVDADQLGRFAQPEFPFEVTPDRVVHIAIADAGTGRHVYNLQTATHWYVANGIVSHNCIFAQEGTELTVNGVEALDTRLRNGKVSFQQLIVDCNPSHPSHFLLERANSGNMLMLESRHEDNPRYFNEDGTMTPEGVSYIARLDALTGVRYLRLRKGIWAAAEGVIYDGFDKALHVIDPFEVPDSWERIWAVDFGFTNPFCWQDWAVDEDGRGYLVREIYMSGRLVEDHARQILALLGDGPAPSAIVCDHDAEDRATLERHLGMGTVSAVKAVSRGIETVAARLKLAGDGRPRMFFFRDALVERDTSLLEKKLPTCTIEEIPGYIWAPEPPGADRKDRQPVKRNDHGCDTKRYFAMELDEHGSTNIRWG